MTSPQLQPHEYRVIDERDDLKGKVERLDVFTGSERFRDLDGTTQFTLVTQLNFMRGYLRCLEKRIEAFK